MYKLFIVYKHILTQYIIIVNPLRSIQLHLLPLIYTETETETGLFG